MAYPTCSHCLIEIDSHYDTACTVEVHGEDVIVCDSCQNEHAVWGDEFGDDTTLYREAFGGCPHKQWASEEIAARQAERVMAG